MAGFHRTHARGRAERCDDDSAGPNPTQEVDTHGNFRIAVLRDCVASTALPFGRRRTAGLVATPTALSRNTADKRRSLRVSTVRYTLPMPAPSPDEGSLPTTAEPHRDPTDRIKRADRAPSTVDIASVETRPHMSTSYAEHASPTDSHCVRTVVQR